MININLLKHIEAEHNIRFMNSACGGIDIGAAYDCENPITPGVNQRLLLGNLDDIETITYSLTVPTLIENITMKTGKAVFAFEGIRQSLNPQYVLVPQTVSVGYDHQIDFLAFDISQEQKDNLEKMALSKLFGVIENKNAIGNANSIFEAFGIGVGMEAISISRINSDQESGGAFTISLKTSDNEGKEPKMPQSWFDTDYPTTLALVNALLIPAT